VKKYTDGYKLTLDNCEHFFKYITSGYYTYDDNFMFADVAALAKKEGYSVSYCSPSSFMYQKFGCQTFYVFEPIQRKIEKELEQKEKLSKFSFNPDNLIMPS